MSINRTNRFVRISILALAAGSAQPALADGSPPFGSPVTVTPGITFDPMLDARMRWEHIDAAKDADAVTLRSRFGFEVRHAASHIGFLAEGEGTVALVRHYNAFPATFTASSVDGSSQLRPGLAPVPDPENVELNRLQVQYRSKPLTITLGRQRINLDDQRFVGNVGWRQNEQTFDAVRIEANAGPVSFDGTYANSQRTIFGIDSGTRQSYDGDFILLNAGVRVAPVTIKGFAYLLDYGDALVLANSSQTYGARATGAFPLAKGVKLSLAGSYARQSSYKSTPFKFAADYIAAEGSLTARGFTATAGYEKLGGDSVAGKSFQTPLATLAKFNGWANLFLTTPANGLNDVYGSLGYAFPRVKAVKGLTANVAYHKFDSDYGSVNYGHEWDFTVAFKTGPVSWLSRYATYSASGVLPSTKKFWLQAEFML